MSLVICNHVEDRRICTSCHHGKPHERVVDDMIPDSCGTTRTCIDTEIQMIEVKCTEVKDS